MIDDARNHEREEGLRVLHYSKYRLNFLGKLIHENIYILLTWLCVTVQLV
jgi:hypothetical protein